jgi:hypothetical protein
MNLRAAWIPVALAACGARTGLDLGAGPADAGALGCTSGPITLAAAEPAAMFVLDRSGSMADEFSGGQSRWQVLTAGLADTLPQVDSSMELGALLFPSTGGGGSPRGGLTCSVPATVDLGLATGHASALVSLLQATNPAGGTPTADAIDVAAGALLATRAATTARALVLATDGAPNCDASLDPTTCTCADTRGCGGQPANCLDDARTVARIAGHAAQGVPTYVIGIASAGDSVFSDVLDAMAVAGGSPQLGSGHAYYAADSASDLDSAIAAIRDQVGKCTYLTTSIPNAGGSITVTLGGVVLPYDPSGATGWMWASESNGQIVLAAGACAEATLPGAPLPVADVECAEM